MTEGPSTSRETTPDAQGRDTTTSTGPQHAGSAHHHSASTPDALSAALVGTADLPRGYHAGAHHQVTSGPPPHIPATCAPIGEVLGTHRSVQQQTHPQASVSFSKSHFGPQLTETIIDYGQEAAAVAALEDLQRASHRCGRYVQSTSRPGANTYTVRPTPDAHRGHPGHHGHDSIALRLAAVGQQFPGLHWDVWATHADGRLAAVAFRSVPGGDNHDWHTAIPTAQAALHSNGSTSPTADHRHR